MHALGAFLQEEMDKRDWSHSELGRQAGISKQSVGNLVDPDRTTLGRMLEPKTFEGLSAALGVPVDTLMLKAAEAMGVRAAGVSDGEALLEHPITTMEELFHFMDGDDLDEEQLLDYLGRCLAIADRIREMLVTRRNELAHGLVGRRTTH